VALHRQGLPEHAEVSAVEEFRKAIADAEKPKKNKKP
jgi:hypothetical protein